MKALAGHNLFNLGLNRQTIDELDVPGPRDSILKAIRLDAADDESFGWMDKVAQKFARYARDANFNFDSGGYQRPDRWNVPIGTYAANVISNLDVFE